MLAYAASYGRTTEMCPQKVKQNTPWSGVKDVKSASIWLTVGMFFLLASACLPA
jgi:hypothetical protein